MSETIVQSVYFDRPGPENTARTIEIAKQRAEETGIRTILVASTTGDTGIEAARAFSGYEVIVVTHDAGWGGPDARKLDSKGRAAIEAAGAQVLTCQDAFAGLGAAVAVRHHRGGNWVGGIVMHTLRMLGEGTKVAAEIALMAADAGLVRVNRPLITITGTHVGADTALVLVPAYSREFYRLRILEVLCKPHLALRSGDG